MRVPRDLAKRIELIEKAIRKRLGPAVNKAQIREVIYDVLAEERLREILQEWEKDWQEMGFHTPEHVSDAVEDLKARVLKDPMLERARSSEASSWLRYFPVVVEVWAEREMAMMEDGQPDVPEPPGSD